MRSASRRSARYRVVCSQMAGPLLRASEQKYQRCVVDLPSLLARRRDDLHAAVAGGTAKEAVEEVRRVEGVGAPDGYSTAGAS